MTLSLAVYGVLSQEVGATIEAADCELLARQERVIHFNGLLKKHCAELGVEYIDIFDEMTEGALLTTTCDLPLLATYHLLLTTTCYYLLLTAAHCSLPPPTASLLPPYASSLPPTAPLTAPLTALRYHPSLPPTAPQAPSVSTACVPTSSTSRSPISTPCGSMRKGPRRPRHSPVAPWPPLGRRLAARLDRHGGLRCRAQRVPELEPPRLSTCRCERPLSNPSPSPNPDQVWETTVLLWISKLPWLKQRVPPNFEQARATACKHMHASLQPQACEPAAVCLHACSYKHASLQPHACEPAPCGRRLPTWSTLGAHLEQATRESLAAYFKTKPWARRAHPSIVAQGDGSPEAEQVRRTDFS